MKRLHTDRSRQPRSKLLTLTRRRQRQLKVLATKSAR